MMPPPWAWMCLPRSSGQTAPGVMVSGAAGDVRATKQKSAAMAKGLIFIRLGMGNVSQQFATNSNNFGQFVTNSNIRRFGGERTIPNNFARNFLPLNTQNFAKYAKRNPELPERSTVLRRIGDLLRIAWC